MTVKLTKSGETMEVNDSWGHRLIEQGLAVVEPKKETATASKKGSRKESGNGAD